MLLYTSGTYTGPTLAAVNMLSESQSAAQKLTLA